MSVKIIMWEIYTKDNSITKEEKQLIKTGKYLFIKLLKEIKINDTNSNVISEMMRFSRTKGGPIFQFDNCNYSKWSDDVGKPGVSISSNEYKLVKTEEDLINIFKDIKTVKVFAKMINNEILIELKNK